MLLIKVYPLLICGLWVIGPFRLVHQNSGTLFLVFLNLFLKHIFFRIAFKWFSCVIWKMFILLLIVFIVFSQFFSSVQSTLRCTLKGAIENKVYYYYYYTIPEFSLESDSESDVSEDSDAFSGRLGSCAISMGVSLYSGLLPIRKETTKKNTFRRYKSFTLPAENHSQPS